MKINCHVDPVVPPRQLALVLSKKGIIHIFCQKNEPFLCDSCIIDALPFSYESDCKFAHPSIIIEMKMLTSRFLVLAIPLRFCLHRVKSNNFGCTKIIHRSWRTRKFYHIYYLKIPMIFAHQSNCSNFNAYCSNFNGRHIFTIYC